MMERDVINVASDPASETGRTLTATPWSIAVQVTHQEIDYGMIIEEMQGGYIAKCLKQAVFRAVRDAIVENSRS